MSFILGCIILLNESLSFRCTQNEFHKIKYGLCHEFRSATNTCSWFDGDSDTRNKESTIHLNNQETETVEDSTVRRISLGLSVLGVFNSIVMLILLSVVFKVMIIIKLILLLYFLSLAEKDSSFLSFQMGNPVYLPKKRHKASIVVGNANNAQLACENKTKNLTLCLAEEDEINTYTSKKTIRLKEYYAKRTKTSVAALVSKENSLLAPNRKEMSALIAKSRSETLEIVHSRKGTSARVPSRNETSLKASSRKETSARATSRKETSVKSTNRKATSEIAQTQIVQIDKTKRGQEHKIEKNQQQIEKKLERNRTIIKNYYL